MNAHAQNILEAQALYDSRRYTALMEHLFATIPDELLNFYTDKLQDAYDDANWENFKIFFNYITFKNKKLYKQNKENLKLIEKKLHEPFLVKDIQAFLL